MLTLLSPAKTLDFDTPPITDKATEPVFLEQSADLIDILKQYSPDALGKLMKLSPMSFEIKGQLAGVRPATKDRKPFVGIHPEHKPLGIFNGLGTKGVSLAPYFAENFIDFLESKAELVPEVDVFRYF